MLRLDISCLLSVYKNIYFGVFISKNIPVIAFVSPKGGAGKTTASLLLASEFVNQFGSESVITIIDADPNFPFKRWAGLGKKPDNIHIILDESEETILDNINVAKEKSKVVIIDLEGTKNMRVTYAVSQADLVLIPVQGSMLDANEAVEAIKLIKRTEQGFGKSILYSVLFTRLPAAITSRNFLDISKQFSDAKIPILSSSLVEREAFKAIFSTGKSLYDLRNEEVSGLAKAQNDTYELAKNVIKIINSKNKKAA
jgi:chromosome partitioning protein